jgi:hypothetical protein
MCFDDIQSVELTVEYTVEYECDASQQIPYTLDTMTPSILSQPNSAIDSLEWAYPRSPTFSWGYPFIHLFRVNMTYC